QDRFDKIRQEEAAIYQKLELDHGELQSVKTMLEQLNDYKQAVEDVRHGKRSQDEAFSIMENHPLWIETQKEIEHLSGDKLENEIRNLEEKAGRFEFLVEEISGIKQKIITVQEGTVLEDALAKRDAAIENLQALYEKSLTANTGAMLVQHLKEETREHNYPPVFKKASMRFEKITGGRYSLKMQSGDEENFMAFDNQNQNFLSLDKLSTGTRIQLLLSVRLAFIEMQESDYKLPLLADELLANSDDVRAEAVIQALLEIAREGRQVFYFTAQRDEVFKWQAHLNQSDVQHQLVTISAADNKTELLSPESRVEVLSLTHENLPEPEGDSHAVYAKKIEPPA
ncbi:MAG TPA: hypothetical protein VJ946_00305, partial [Bacteroidales bacterium]|nr:hypothetical protein [Bacteroidales bacterium]